MIIKPAYGTIHLDLKYNWYQHFFFDCDFSVFIIGYNGTFKKRSGDRPDGCATFFKRDKFSIAASYKIDYYRENVPLMEQNNVAILLFLNIRGSEATKKSTICISNTHLLFNQRRGDIKLAQLAHLLADIEYHSRSDRYDSNRLSIILCGDFNSRPFSPLYKLITTGELKYEGLSRVQVSGQLNDSRDNSKLGKTLFPSSIGLTNNCRWNDSEAEANSSREIRKVGDGNFRDDFMSTFNVETGMYEVLHRDEKIHSKRKHNDARRYSLTERQESSDSSSDVDGEIQGYLRHGYSFSSCYSHTRHDGTPEVTICLEHDSSNVDYIFYTEGDHEPGKDQLILNSVLTLFNEKELNAMNKLPNRFFSSDHLLLQASFVLHQA